MKVLLTGASGYIGGRLATRLLAQGHSVRCLARDPRKLDQHHWRDEVEVARGDVLEPEPLADAMRGCDTAYYLVHSMGGAGESFAARDARAARTFQRAADEAGLRRVIYLGGLGEGARLSEHLRSRQEVGQILAEGSTPVTEVRAAVIIGSGSLSFEMMRYLTEVLPVMVTPTWVRTTCQPIAISNVLEILSAALESTEQGHTIWEIGGPDQVTYEEMMQIYADVAGLRRRIIVPVPVLSPQLSKHWVGLVTPLPAAIAKPLVDSLRNEVTVHDNSIASEMTERLVPFRKAIEMALADPNVATRWSDAAPSPAEARASDPSWAGGTTYTDERRVPGTAPPEDVFWAFTRIGGDTGYYTFNWAWKVRGLIDSLVGGVGLRRGRRHPEELRPGEALDFWRVASIEPDRRLQLAAEMRLPGDAWLEFAVKPAADGSELRQTAMFRPRGLLGRLYWWGVTPFHTPIFRGMARRIIAAAEGRADDRTVSAT